MSEEVMASETTSEQQDQIAEQQASEDVSHEANDSVDSKVETPQASEDAQEGSEKPETYTKDHVDHIVLIQQKKAERQQRKLQAEFEAYKQQAQQVNQNVVQQPTAQNQSQPPNTHWDDLVEQYVPDGATTDQYRQIVIDATLKASEQAGTQQPTQQQQTVQQPSVQKPQGYGETPETEDQFIECEVKHKDDFVQIVNACSMSIAMGNAASAFTAGKKINGIEELYKAAKSDPMAVLKISKMPEQQQAIAVFDLLNKKLNAPKKIVDTKATPQPEAISGSAHINRKASEMSQDELNEETIRRYYK